MARIDSIPKNFEPSEREDAIFEQWMAKGYFLADPKAEGPTFTIMMPPPNVTGELHMGHALNNTLQDILIRWRRMAGDNVLWQAGTDHAAIATEARIVESLAKEGITKDDLGREKFLEKAWEWTEHFNNRITSQLQRLGSSYDPTRVRFTMDEGLSAAVVEVFNSLYEEGRIYRGERMINWCPSCLTTLSDIEVIHEEQATKIWTIAYPLEDGSGELLIATTRPETMLADTAVAVHPEDERYADLVGKRVKLPLTDRLIPIIADAYVSTEFGTGAVKITPAHDPNDYEIGQRHDLETIDMLNDDATVADGYAPYSGKSREEARQMVVKDLEAQGYLRKTEDYSHNVGTCQRCGTTVEPKLSLQWFVKMEELAKNALASVESGDIRFVPERFGKSYKNWVENTRDWCISRQLWWGHRIPAWHCEHCGKFTVARETPDVCEHCGSDRIIQDPDTLDTWFSSALWPFSTLGWPDTEDPYFKRYYPTDVLVTGYDIIGFWVAKMIEQALHFTDSRPFHTVFLNGIVRDEQGRKMSKSLGNGIDPLKIIDTSGADSLRYALVTGTTAGNDQRFQQDVVENGRAFINKVWNAFRFIMMHWDDSLDEALTADTLEVPADDLTDEDRWILSRLARTASEVERNLEHFELGLALDKIYTFIWNEYCDWYLEMVKPRLFDKEEAGKATRHTALRVLHYVMSASIRMLHPFMPFFTEAIYQMMPAHGESIMIAPWPYTEETLGSYRNPELDQRFERLIEAVRGIRQLRLTYEVKPQARVSMTVVSEAPDVRELFEQSESWLERLAGVNRVRSASDRSTIGETDAQLAFPGGEAYIPLEDLVDIEQETERLTGEIEKHRAALKKAEGMLANKNFTERAPEAVVDKERARKAEAEEQIARIEERIRALSAFDESDA